MQLTPTQIPVDSRTKQLTAVVQTLFSAPTKENGKKRFGPARLVVTHIVRYSATVTVVANNHRIIFPEQYRPIVSVSSHVAH